MKDTGLYLLWLRVPVALLSLLWLAGPTMAGEHGGKRGNPASRDSIDVELQDPLRRTLTIVDVTNPADPRFAKELKIGEPLYHANLEALVGSTALLTEESSQSTATVTPRSVSIVSFADPAGQADRAPLPLPGPVHTVTAEPGVVPPGTFLVVRTSDTVSTRRAYRGTIYSASVAEDVLDQSDRVLIPKGSPIELTVRSFSFLGPGGVGMTELRLAARTVTVNGVRYPVETGETHEGLGANRTGSGEGGQLMTRGGRINVPAGTLLTFRIEDPIRLRGYRQ